ncbi:MAG: hypothetical protein ABW007_20855 [Chitinophagaceae bacterium]
MKKIFTLAFVSLFTISIFAADRKPSVTLTADKRYEVVIDGRSYASSLGSVMDISLLNKNGRHTVKVYELKNGLFSKQKKLVNSATFTLNRNSVDISVDRNGRIAIREERDARNNRNDDDRNRRVRF